MSENSDQWAWLGLLKWSLSYTDGTERVKPSQMSDDDKSFLEAVIRDGIVNEGDTMKSILHFIGKKIELWKNRKFTPSEEEEVLQKLVELRDIVEQIDYARAFSAMSGLNFVLGCVQQQRAIPGSIRKALLGLISTLCQNNPPVQQQLLELESIRILCQLYFDENDRGVDLDGSMKGMVIQAISANVRSYDLAENVFEQLPQSPVLLSMALSEESETVVKKALFLLKALLTSDTSSESRYGRFHPCIIAVVENHLTAQNSDVRELALEFVNMNLEQNENTDAVRSRHAMIYALGTNRLASIRNSGTKGCEEASIELQLWESIIAMLTPNKKENLDL